MPKRTNAKDVKGDSIHPRSRKAQQLQRIVLRQHKLGAARTSHTNARVAPVLDRVTWFQMRIDPSLTHALSAAEAHGLVAEYLARHDNERARLEGEARPGRPRAKRLDEIAFAADAEAREYAGSGLAIPDVTDDEALARLRVWDGTRESLDRVPLVRLSRDGSSKAVKYADV